MTIDLSSLAKAYGLPDMGLDDPRIPDFIKDALKRHSELSGREALDEQTDELMDMMASQSIQSKLVAELAAAGAKATALSDDDLMIIIEQATDTAMLRHFDAKRRVFPTRLTSSQNGQIRADVVKRVARMPEALRTGAHEKRHLTRLADAARRVVSEMISLPVSPETMFAVEDLLIDETIYAAARKALGFMEMGDAEILRMIQLSADAKSAKIARMMREGR